MRVVVVVGSEGSRERARNESCSRQGGGAGQNKRKEVQSARRVLFELINNSQEIKG